MISIGKENRSSQCLSYKEQEEGGGGGGGGGGGCGEREKKKRRRKGGRGWVGRQSEGLGGVVWVYKIGLK